MTEELPPAPAYPPPPRYPAQYYPPPPPYPGQQYYAPYPPPKPPKPAFPHDRPRPYHQMLRTWDYEWWKSAVGIFMVIVGFVLVAPFAAMPVLLVALLFESGSYFDNLQSFLELDEITPAGMLYLNLAIALSILVTWLAIRVCHGMKPRWLASVAPRLRWSFLFVCLGLSVISLAVSIALGAVLPGAASGDVGGGLNEFTATTAWIALIVLLTTPFQAAGEEYVFRGYLLQAIGSFTEKAWGRWFTILLTSLVFACAHLQFDGPVFFDRFAFGVVAGWLVIRTGGLEAGIALHVLNNYVAFGLALAFGDINESLSDPQASWWNILTTLAQSLSYAWLVWYAAKRMNLRNTTQPPVTTT